ncbi:hypothetical protein H1S01_03225 [Heliobacterium chlorum]|uniref:DUF7768 domain-containing protein n=1 Tax=Heliobacterium chlorum TaxID=2698 RepID=A0ABR7SYB5_HELCL|nr:DUF4406 domain-containing protein [Heliobacterium chlorum]MBC9783523.1 hypothetical protein [Heliobacterium chlorum]
MSTTTLDNRPGLTVTEAREIDRYCIEKIEQSRSSIDQMGDITQGKRPKYLNQASMAQFFRTTAAMDELARTACWWRQYDPEIEQMMLDAMEMTMVGLQEMTVRMDQVQRDKLLYKTSKHEILFVADSEARRDKKRLLEEAAETIVPTEDLFNISVQAIEACRSCMQRGEAVEKCESRISMLRCMVPIPPGMENPPDGRCPYQAALGIKRRRVGISHPLKGDIPGNMAKIDAICRWVYEQHPDVVPVSFVHMFSFLDDTQPEQRKRALLWCIDILLGLDELWVFGDWEKSEGCCVEVEAAKRVNMPIIVWDPKFDELKVSESEPSTEKGA